MQTEPSPSRSQPRPTREVPSPSSSPTLPPPLPLLHNTSTHLRHNSTALFLWETLPSCPSASPPTKSSSPFILSRLPSSPRTPRNFSQASPTRSTTPRTSASSRPGSSTPTQNPSQAKPRPRSSSQFTQVTSPRWEPQSDFSPGPTQLSGPTPPTVILSAETAGASAMSHNGAIPKIRSAACALSTIAQPTIDA